jgi:hypothetical protein
VAMLVNGAMLCLIRRPVEVLPGRNSPDTAIWEASAPAGWSPTRKMAPTAIRGDHSPEVPDPETGRPP